MLVFDELLAEIGEFGAYQKRVCLLGCIPGAVFAVLFVGVVFLAHTPEHWCHDPSAERLQEECSWPNRLLFPHHCRKFDVDWNSTEVSCSQLPSLNSTPLTSCKQGWNFDPTLSTIVSEFELVCEDAWKADLNQAFLNIGMLFGAVSFGYAADRYGRKYCFLWSALGLTVSGIGMIFSPDYTVLLVIRILQGIFGRGVWMSAYVLVTEIVTYKQRRLVSIMAQIFFTLGVMSLPGIAYMIPSWKMLQVAITIPVFLLLTYYWLIPESPRWLLSVKRTEEAIRIIKHIAQKNGKPFPLEYVERQTHASAPEEKVPTTPSVTEVFRTAQMRKITLILMYAWFTSSVVYQGLVMRIGITQVNMHLEFFLSAVVELPSAVLYYLTIDRVGRLVPFVASNIVGGVACLATAFLPVDTVWLKSVIAILGRLAITLGFEILYLISTELYPTPLRNLGFSLVSCLSDIGGIAAPFLLFRLASIWTELPMVLYGVMCLIYGGLVCLLPETKGIDLPEAIGDIEALGKHGRSHRRP